ncbi:OmpA family protein [Aquincola sp. S2]|uniref:OmpA family protein n=1 Tax=Pseudaquabacterium terrae TaxID=2732868 RepID=A0ABX2ESG7_9BURK|nr:OmpA family protein [Aquabacterium terrae]NRF71379.1 OmpA family protein [Aquabacterium terrae]
MNLRALAAAALLAGCSSPPKPPSVDDSVRRPINSAQAIELQRCSAENRAARIALTEAEHRANVAVAGAAADSLAAARRAAQTCAPGARTSSGSSVFVVPFVLGSAKLELPPDQAERIASAAKMASAIVIRGRTDAAADSPAESALAKRRAEAAGTWLVQRGVSRDRVRLQWQGAGDRLISVDAKSALQRRVEIEIYEAAPPVETVANLAL